MRDNNEKLYSGGGDGRVDGNHEAHCENVVCAAKQVIVECGGSGESRVRNVKCAYSDNQECVAQSQGESGWCDALEEQLEHLGKGTTWMAIILGQVLSALLCVSAFASVQLVETYKIRIPNAQNFAFYIVLATVCTTILACRQAERNLFPILRTRGWKYAFVALADAEANYLVNKAFQLTTLPSVQLLDCFTIPTVLSLSWLVLKIRFKVPHILGVSICLLGVSCLVWADIEDGKPLGSIKDRFLGDMLCLAGAFLLGISNITEEFVVKTFDGVEFLGMIGLFGSFVSGTQTVLLEYGEVADMDLTDISNPPLIVLIVYASAKLAFYLLATVVIKHSGATLLNLSLLSADFYSLILSIYFLRVKFHALYFLSYVLVMTGVLTFSIKPTILGSHVYKSLTREHTTTLDLELMASSPSSSGFPLAGNQQNRCASNGHHHTHQRSQSQEEVCIGGAGSLLASEKGHCSGANGSKCLSNGTMLSNEGCDVVLQTTAILGRDGRNVVHQTYRKGSNGVSSPIPEEPC